LVTRGDEVLLARNKFFPENWYSTLAGFIEAGETAEEALRREVMEEVNISVKNITYFGSQPWPFPSQLMLGYFCEYESGEIKIEEAELEDAKWFKIDELPNVPPKLSISGQLISSYLEDRSKL
jgi:NAD+ diphosphatase